MITHKRQKSPEKSDFDLFPLCYSCTSYPRDQFADLNIDCDVTASIHAHDTAFLTHLYI